MKLEGTYTFDAPRELVWEMFFDTEVLAKTMPGCERLDHVGDNEYRGKLILRVGPVQGAFQGTVKLSDLSEPERYHMEVSGKGPAGFVNGSGDVRLEQTENGTVMHYSGDAQVGGRLAQVGQRLLDSSARAITRQSLDNLDRQIQAHLQAETGPSPAGEETTPTPATDVEAPTQTEFALGVAREMAADLIAPEQRFQLLTWGLAALGTILSLRLLLNWWTDLLARKIAQHVQEQNQ